jgi:hypothetical protein
MSDDTIPPPPSSETLPPEPPTDPDLRDPPVIVAGGAVRAMSVVIAEVAASVARLEAVGHAVARALDATAGTPR